MPGVGPPAAYSCRARRQCAGSALSERERRVARHHGAGRRAAGGAVPDTRCTRGSIDSSTAPARSFLRRIRRMSANSPPRRKRNWPCRIFRRSNSRLSSSQRRAMAATSIDEVIAMPIISHETGEVHRRALALGFKPSSSATCVQERGIKSGIWVNGKLHLPCFHRRRPGGAAGRDRRRPSLRRRVPGTSFKVEIAAQPYLLFFKRLNPDSLFPPAYEVCLYPLAELLARQRRLRWEVLGAERCCSLGGFAASHFVSRKLSVPVEKLVIDSGGTTRPAGARRSRVGDDA